METPNMSKPLFEFVKVAAGEPFKWPTGNYSYNYTGKLDSTVYYDDFIQGKTGKNDVYILRPAESPDAGREGFIEKVLERIRPNLRFGWSEVTCDDFRNFMRSHWPTPADPGSQVEAVDPVKLLEWVRKNGFFPDIDNEWTKYNHGTRSYEVFKDADLITLYKQSL